MISDVTVIRHAHTPTPERNHVNPGFLPELYVDLGLMPEVGFLWI